MFYNKTQKTHKMKNTRKQIEFLLSNNMEVNIHNENYDVKNDRGNLIVVCNLNGYTTPLQDSEIEECYASKWYVREYEELTGFNVYPTVK